MIHGMIEFIETVRAMSSGTLVLLILTVAAILGALRYVFTKLGIKPSYHNSEAGDFGTGDCGD